MAASKKSKSAKASGKTVPRLQTQTDLSGNATPEIAEALNDLLADAFALYMKTKNFHWHVSGPHFYGYHLLFDERAAEIYASTDALAERVRRIGGKTLHSISEIAKHQTIKDNNKDFVAPQRHAEKIDGRQQDGDQCHAQGA